MTPSSPPGMAGGAPSRGSARSPSSPTSGERRAGRAATRATSASFSSRTAGSGTSRSRTTPRASAASCTPGRCGAAGARSRRCTTRMIARCRGSRTACDGAPPHHPGAQRRELLVPAPSPRSATASCAWATPSPSSIRSSRRACTSRCSRPSWRPAEILAAFRENRFEARRFRAYERTRPAGACSPSCASSSHFYEPAFLEMFLQPRECAGMLDGVTGVLAGGAFLRMRAPDAGLAQPSSSRSSGSIDGCAAAGASRSNPASSGRRAARRRRQRGSAVGGLAQPGRAGAVSRSPHAAGIEQDGAQPGAARAPTTSTKYESPTTPPSLHAGGLEPERKHPEIGFAMPTTVESMTKSSGARPAASSA